MPNFEVAKPASILHVRYLPPRTQIHQAKSWRLELRAPCVLFRLLAARMFCALTASTNGDHVQNVAKVCGQVAMDVDANCYSPWLS